jgi:hypothetical protein
LGCGIRSSVRRGVVFPGQTGTANRQDGVARKGERWEGSVNGTKGERELISQSPDQLINSSISREVEEGGREVPRRRAMGDDAE